MRVYQCDRCGITQPIENTAGWGVVRIFEGLEPQMPFLLRELCVKCLKRVQEIITTPPAAEGK